MPPVNIATMPNEQLIQYILDLTVKREKLEIDHAAAFTYWLNNDGDLVKEFNDTCRTLLRKIKIIRSNLNKAYTEKGRRDIQEIRYREQIIRVKTALQSPSSLPKADQ